MATDTMAMLESIEAASRPLALADLLALHPDMPRRTAQRRLARLLQEGAIQAIGEGRGRQYSGRKVSAAASVTERIRGGGPAPGRSFPAGIPITEDGQEILAYVDRPLEVRTPVGYDRDFLMGYRPGETWYLTQAQRTQLRRMGEPAMADARTTEELARERRPTSPTGARTSSRATKLNATADRPV